MAKRDFNVYRYTERIRPLESIELIVMTGFNSQQSLLGCDAQLPGFPSG